MKLHIYRVMFHNEVEEFVEAGNRMVAYRTARAVQAEKGNGSFVRSVRRLINRDINWLRGIA